MNEEVKNALSALKEGLEKKAQEELKSLTEQFEGKLEGVISEEKLAEVNTTITELKEHNNALQKHLDELDIALQKGKDVEEEKMNPVMLYFKKMTEAITEKAEEIKEVEVGNSLRFEVKAPMLISTNLTGDPVKTYNETPAAIPFQRVNFAQLVPNISSRTGVYTFYVESAPTGAPDYQTEGAAKAEVNFNLVETICNARYLAGWTQISKQMLQDLPFMNSFLPSVLRREYFKAENGKFYGELATAATGVSTNTGGIAGIIEDIGVLESNDYDVTGIVLNPADWAALAATTIPGATQSAVVSFVNNNMIIAGVPVFKASWVPAGKYMLGDWFYAKKIVVDGLGVNFYEQDQDNVIKNLITVKIESRVCLAVERPDAFIEGNVAPAQ